MIEIILKPAVAIVEWAHSNHTEAIMKYSKLSLIGLLMLSYPVIAQNDHNNMDHQTHMAQPGTTGENTQAMAVLPTEAGNDVFGTIQEIINLLNEDPSTDWKQVNIEALRLHLVDMQDMTINVNVVSQKAIPNGLIAVIEPTTPRAAGALARVMMAHPAQLEQETGWVMNIDKRGRRYALTITTENAQEVDKIRGLGYIGLMAYGAHHQPHHWSMATGHNPH